MKKLGILWILMALASQNSFAQCWTTSYVDFGELKNVNIAPSIEGYNAVNAVSIVNDSIAYIGGCRFGDFKESKRCHLFKTLDGGKTWNRMDVPFDRKLDQVNHLYFSNIDTGWVVGKPTSQGPRFVFTTTDGGKTWKEPLNAELFVKGSNLCWSAFNENAKTLWVIMEPSNDSLAIFYTKDFGASWNYFPTNKSAGVGLGLHTKGNGEGWRTTQLYDDQALMKRKPGTFEFYSLPNLGFEKGRKMSFKGDIGCMGVHPWSRTIMMTKDYGKTWFKALNYDTAKSFLEVPNLWSMHVVDSLETLVGGFKIQADAILWDAVLKKTRDGGKTWRDIKLGQKSSWPIIDIKSYARDFALAVGDTNRIYVYRRPAPPICDVKILTGDTLKSNELLTWAPASGCIGGYYLSIGTAANKKDILDSLDVQDVLSYNLSGIVPKQTIFVSLTPYNDGGVAPVCTPKKIYLQQCTLVTRLDTMIKPGTPINDVLFLKDTVLSSTYKSVLGCDSIVNLFVDVLTSTTDLPEELAQAISVAPNPTSANLQITFQLKSATTGSLSITDRLGRILWKTDQRAWSVGAQSVPIDVSHYPSGVYQVHWRSASGISVVSWVKQD